MSASTQEYIDLAQSDDEINAASVATLQDAIKRLRPLSERAAIKADALVAMQSDERREKVRALLPEGHDRQKTVQRLFLEWREKTLLLLCHIDDVEAFDQRLVAVVQAEEAVAK